MSSLRRVSATAVAAVCSTGMAGVPSCGTDAVGVDDCRKIEAVRCDAAAHCPGSFAVDDVDACKRYYRDHCLHGLQVEDRPGSPVLNRCVAAIKAAGECAAEESDMTVADCANDNPALSAATGLESVCDVIEYPEQTDECYFLAVEPEPLPTTDDDSGGAAGAGGTAGTSGATTAGSEG